MALGVPPDTKLAEMRIISFRYRQETLYLYTNKRRKLADSIVMEKPAARGFIKIMIIFATSRIKHKEEQA